uniref:Venom peptide HtTxB n=1 Tax=Hadogenes troglodytes TaxID=1577150 RepID=A0A1B3IJ22_9SCOR|nr:venom peptide HtTxB [Hadogenes troglodytes]
MKLLIVTAALVVVLSAQMYEDPLCHAPSEVVQSYISCMRKNYQPAFGHALNCSSFLGKIEDEDFILFSCGKIKASEDQERMYGECLKDKVTPSMALPEDELSKVVESCRKTSLSS